MQSLPERSLTSQLRIAHDSLRLFQVTGASYVPDELIAVANGGSSELLLFSLEGRLTGRVGGEGEGPGEFMSLGGVWWSERKEELLAWGNRSRRLSRFDIEGNLIGTQAITGAFLNGPRMIGEGKEGIILIHEHFQLPGTQLTPLPLEFLEISEGGETIGRWGPWPWARLLWPDAPNGPVRSRLFDVWAKGDVAGSHLFYVDGRYPAVVVIDLTSGDSINVKWELEARTPTQADLEAWARWERDRLSDLPGPAVERVVKAGLEIGPVDEFPAVSNVVGSEDGGFWVKRFTPVFEEESVWWVFDADLTPVNKVVLQRDVEVLEVGAGYALILKKDAFGREALEKVGW